MQKSSLHQALQTLLTLRAIAASDYHQNRKQLALKITHAIDRLQLEQWQKEMSVHKLA